MTKDIIKEFEKKLSKIERRSANEDVGKKKADILNKLAKAYSLTNPATSFKYAQKALVVAEKNDYQTAIATSFYHLAFYYMTISEYNQSLEYCSNALRVFEETEDNQGLAQTYSCIGMVYNYLTDYKTALEYLLKAVGIYEKSEDRLGIAKSYHNIGMIYSDQKSYDFALKYYLLAKEIYEKLGEMEGVGMVLNNVGSIYLLKDDPDSALDYYKKSLPFNEKAGSIVVIARALSNIGSAYINMGEYKKSIDYLLRSLKMKEESGDRFGVAATFINIGKAYTNLSDFNKSLDYMKKGLDIALDIGAKSLQVSAYLDIHKLYKKAGNYELSLESFRDYHDLNQEVFNEKSAGEIANLQIKYEAERKEKEAEIYRLRNVELREEISKREVVEQELQEYQKHLEKIVEIRTVELQKSLKKLDASHRAIIQTISKIFEVRDPYTSGHQIRTATLAKSIAEVMGLPEYQVEAVYIAAAVHDIGKIAIPHKILSKPGMLTNLEFDIIKTHVNVGFEILSDIDFPWSIADIVLQHHERIDGSGYPGQISGDDLIIEARILGVADVVEAMSSHRPYRPALNPDDVLNEISGNQGRLYDGDVVEAFAAVVADENIDFSLA